MHSLTIKKSFVRLVGALLLAFSLGSVAKANPITGEIDIAQFGAQALIDFGTNTVTFSAPAPNNNARVSFADGSYASVDPVGTAVSYSNFTYSPFVGPTTIWRINSTTYFVLNAITLVAETPGVGLVLQGSGTAFLTGYDPTDGTWSFSASKTGTRFAYSSTDTSVPDGGTTAALLGVSLLGIYFFNRRRTVKA